MTTSKPDLEEALEQETIALFAELQWETADCFDETFGSQAGASVQRPYIGRDNKGEVILIPRLRAGLPFAGRSRTRWSRSWPGCRPKGSSCAPSPTPRRRLTTC